MKIVIVLIALALIACEEKVGFDTQPTQATQAEAPKTPQEPANIFASRNVKVIRVCDSETGNLAYIAINTRGTNVASQVAVVEGGCK